MELHSTLSPMQNDQFTSVNPVIRPPSHRRIRTSSCMHCDSWYAPSEPGCGFTNPARWLIKCTIIFISQNETTILCVLWSMLQFDIASFDSRMRYHSSLSGVGVKFPISKAYILTTRSCRNFSVRFPRMQLHDHGTSWKLWVFARDFVCAFAKSGRHLIVSNHTVRVIYLVAVMLFVIGLLTIVILSLCRPMRSQKHFGPQHKKASSAWNSAAYERRKMNPCHTALSRC